MENLAIIPARGGSKGILNKNIKNIAGKPLVAWSIEQALASQNIDRVVVTTDSQEIADVAVKFGAEVPFFRPTELASDTAATDPCLIHAIEWLKIRENYYPDNTILLQPTSPVRKLNSIDQAFDKFFESGVDSLLGVCKFFNFLWTQKDEVVPLYDFCNRPRRQDITIADMKYMENGSIYISKTDRLLESKNRLSGKIGLFEMSEEENYEIDSQTDWIIVEALLENMNLGRQLC